MRCCKNRFRVTICAPLNPAPCWPSQLKWTPQLRQVLARGSLLWGDEELLSEIMLMLSCVCWFPLLLYLCFRGCHPYSYYYVISPDFPQPNSFVQWGLYSQYGPDSPSFPFWEEGHDSQHSNIRMFRHIKCSVSCIAKTRARAGRRNNYWTTLMHYKVDQL